MLKSLLAFLLCFLFVHGVFAADIERAVITHDGVKGFFFSEDAGTKILLDLEAYKVQSERIKLLDTKLALMDTKVLLLEQSVELAEQIAGKYRDSYILENKLRVSEAEAYEEKLARKDAWYKHPLVFFGIGFVLASGMAIGLSFGLQEARSN